MSFASLSPVGFLGSQLFDSGEVIKSLLKELRNKKLWPLSEALKTPKAKAVFFGSVGVFVIAVTVGLMVVAGAGPLPQSSQSGEQPKATSSKPNSSNPSPTGSAKASPSPRGSSSPSASSSSNMTPGASLASDGLDSCRIREASGPQGYTMAGFPISSRTANSGVVKWALIPIDFPDMPGQANFRSRVDDQMRLLTEWFSSVSGGRFIVEWVVLDRWSTLPGQSSEYAIPLSVNLRDAANGPKLFRDAMNAADPFFDFTGVQTVNFILPAGQNIITETSQGFPWDEAVQQYSSQEGPIASFSIPGQFMDQPGRTYWSYWAHEFGHAIALPHIGSSRGSLPPFNPWDLMGGQDGPSRELSGWLRFLAGWLSVEQVVCLEASNVQNLEMTLVPLSGTEPGPKFAVLKLSATRALLIESRRETKFSCKTPTPRNGVLVYVYDATIGHGENFLIPSSPPGRQAQNLPCTVEPNPDFLLRTGDKVVVEGFTVEVLEHGNLDRVLVTKN